MNEDKEYITRKELEELIDEVKKETKFKKIMMTTFLIFSIVFFIAGLYFYLEDMKFADVLDNCTIEIRTTYQKVQSYEYQLEKIKELEQKSKYYEEASDIIMDLYNYSNLMEIVETWGKSNASS